MLIISTLNEQILVDPAAIHEARRLYAPPEHPVFELVPTSFGILAEQFYAAMDNPAVNRDNVWDVYLCLLAHFRLAEALPPNCIIEWQQAVTLGREERTENGDRFDLIPDLAELPENSGRVPYMGGVNNGHGLGKVLKFAQTHVILLIVRIQAKRKIFSWAY